MPSEDQFHTGEVSINYAESAGPGLPMVLLHGLTLNWQSFGSLIPTLAQSWHVYACDLRGHGRSGWARSGYRIIDYIPDTVAFIQQQVGQPTVLLGHSTGALVALLAAARLPTLTRALILLEPPLLFHNTSIRSTQETDAYKWVTWVHETLISRPSIDEISAKAKEFFPGMGDSDAHNIATMVHPIDPATIATQLNDQTLAGVDLEQEMQQVGCPTLLLYGEPELGSVLRSEDLELARSCLPQCVAVQIKGTGHDLVGQQTEQVLANIAAFFQPS